MELILLSVIVLLIGYIVYSDIQNRKERENLTLKLMCKDASEFLSLDEAFPETAKEEDPYIDADEAGIEQIVKARETE